MEKLTLIVALIFGTHFYAQKSITHHAFKIQNGIDSLVLKQQTNFVNQLYLNKNASPKISFTENRNATLTTKPGSPYEWKWVRDGIWTGAGLAGAAIGLSFIKNKDDLTDAEFAKYQGENLQKTIDDINFVDRWAAGNHSTNASKLSDIPFAVSFAAPFTLLIDDKVNDNTGQFLGLYLETLATTATMYSLTAGLLNRSRPYVYDDSGETNDERRRKNNGQRSFYAGHVAASASATFFAAKVYNDYHPESPAKTWVWAGAAVIPAGVSYLRIEAGQHFLTDVTVGYIIGAATGILIPELHKNDNENLQIYPTTGMSFNSDEYNAMAISLSF